MAGIASLVVEMRANTALLAQDMSKARRVVEQTSGQMATAFGTVRTALRGLGFTLGAVGVVRGIQSMVNASLEFESSFAGVRKTVNATEPELQKIADEFIQISKEIPVSTTELNKIGEAAGQLGIETKNIVKFSRVMADLGATTNISSAEAATSLARLANITQLPEENFDRLASVIVELGNNMATTESEIVAMGLRLAGAGKQIGLTEGQTLAFAASLSSVGIEAEAGGSSISKIFIQIAQSVATGNDELSTFAKVAGLTTEEFAKAFQEDAAGAIVAFVEGLGRISNSGGNVFKVLESLGITEVRMRDALLRASGAGDLLRKSLDLQATAWSENTALIEEAAKRYGTSASQLKVFLNKLEDVRRQMGGVLVPVLIKFLEVTESVVGALVRAKEATIAFTAALAVQQIIAFAGGMKTLQGALAGIEILAAVRSFAGLRVAIGALIPATKLVQGRMVATTAAIIYNAAKIPTAIGLATLAAVEILKTVPDSIKKAFAADVSENLRLVRDAIVDIGKAALGLIPVPVATWVKEVGEAAGDVLKLLGPMADLLKEVVAQDFEQKGFERTGKAIRALGTDYELLGSTAKTSQQLMSEEAVKQVTAQEKLRVASAASSAAAIAAQEEQSEAVKRLVGEFSASLRPASVLNAEILNLVGAGKSLADITRVYGEEITQAVAAQRAMGQPIEKEIGLLAEQIELRRQTINQLREHVEAQFRLQAAPAILEALRIEAGKLPATVHEGTASVEGLTAAFEALDNIDPLGVDVAASIAELDAAFERLGLKSGFALSGIADQAQKDFGAVLFSGQASFEQITEAGVKAAEAIKAAAEAGFGTWNAEQEKALKDGQERLREFGEEASDTGRDIGTAITSGLEHAMRKWEGFGELAIGILNDIAATILRNAVIAPLTTWLGTILTDALGGLGGLGGSNPVVHLAKGGSIGAGARALVGEAGAPELFVPNRFKEIIRGNDGAKLPPFKGIGRAITESAESLPMGLGKLQQVGNQLRSAPRDEGLMFKTAAPAPGAVKVPKASEALKSIRVLGTKGAEIFRPPAPGTIIPLDTPEGEKIFGRMKELGLSREHGGRVKPWQSYLTGEGGHELFVSDSAGRNVPNSEGGGGVNNYITINAPGAEVGVEQRIMAAFRQAVPGIVQASVDAVEQRKLRGI